MRGFRAVYLGLFFNCMIMATVNLAACKIAGILFGLERWQTLLLVGVLNVVFAAHSGLWGVLVIDMIQFFIKMTAVIAAAYFAVQRAAGRRPARRWWSKLSAMRGPGGLNYLNILPDFTNNWDLAVAVFIMPIAVQWWAVWYPGAEPGGGSYIAQRMLASKSEKDSLGAVLFFNVAHYVLRPWPWILVALCSLIVYPKLVGHPEGVSAPRSAACSATTSRIPAMLKFLPVGFIGLMVGGLIAANSSTILTHLNWGASYLVHDFYRRFITPGRHRAALRARRAGSRRSGCSCCSSGDRLSARHGEGRVRHHPADRRGHRAALSRALVLVARERVVRGRRDGRARSLVSLALPASSPRTASPVSTHAALVDHGRASRRSAGSRRRISAPQTDRDGARRVLHEGAAVRPGLGSRSDAMPACRRDGAPTADNIPLALLGWVAGCTAIWSSLFTVGSFLYGRTATGWTLLAVFAVSATVLTRIVSTLWSANAQS